MEDILDGGKVTFILKIFLLWMTCSFCKKVLPNRVSKKY